jgi:hypothetical protein
MPPAPMNGHEVPTCDCIQFQRRECISTVVTCAMFRKLASPWLNAWNTLGHISTVVGVASV